MVKTILIGIWAVILFGGTSWYFQSLNMKAVAGKAEPEKYFGGLDYVKMDTLIVPTVDDNTVNGYFTLEAVYTIAQADKSKVSVPIEFLLKDIIVGAIYGNPDIDTRRIEKFDLKKFGVDLQEAINKKLGSEIVYDVLVQNFDFISKDEIRDKLIRRS